MDPLQLGKLRSERAARERTARDVSFECSAEPRTCMKQSWRYGLIDALRRTLETSRGGSTAAARARLGRTRTLGSSPSQAPAVREPALCSQERKLSSAQRRRRTTPIGDCLASRPTGSGLNTVPRTPQRLATWNAGPPVLER